MKNPQAFPTHPDASFINDGMTLRDYFAAKAMEGFLVCDVKYASDADMIARDAYTMADAKRQRMTGAERQARSRSKRYNIEMNQRMAA